MPFLSPEDKYTRLDAVRFIAARVAMNAESIHFVENRISHRIAYNVRVGKLLQEADGTFTLNHLGAWAKKIWPTKFDDIPTVNVSWVSFNQQWGQDVAWPSSIEECHLKLKEASQTIDLLHKQIAELTPAADKYKKWCISLGKNAKKYN